MDDDGISDSVATDKIAAGGTEAVQSDVAKVEMMEDVAEMMEGVAELPSERPTAEVQIEAVPYGRQRWSMTSAPKLLHKVWATWTRRRSLA